ncbi:hypothetical protein G7075_00125 [Phycicoccus sp. HDW14]|uniref:hypothetical protein n=1 Tax=Phycicoccus sp. HDW14 TaxID=2714941 RepID=UPI00140CFBE4|nr:hypothetical protein [Phycicoccus sp. HDW14]QIM19902.1 hypothetical protein G7075_00125 [Phycicoccus sp. HDW14]
MTPRAVVVEEVEHFLGFGDRPLSIASHLGMRPESIARALYRAERPDLANRFEQLRGRTWLKPPRPRTHPCADCSKQVTRNAVRCRECHARSRARANGGRFMGRAA